METFFTILLLIIAVIISNIIYQIFPKVPKAIYQILIGVILSFLPVVNGLKLDSEIFFVIILAPLMFYEGKNIDYNNLKKDFTSIFSLAIVLTITTVVIGGGLMHFIWPYFPLALCFMLLAIVAPTDAVAMGSITSRIQMPKGVKRSLESESLFNDASGIVVLSLALSAFSTGTFSITESLSKFLINFFGGAFVGAAIGFLVVWLQRYLRKYINDMTLISPPINIITPFLVYIIDEDLHLSGIIAVVTTGIIFGINSKKMWFAASESQILSNNIWKILVETLNGFVFILLGNSLYGEWDTLLSHRIDGIPTLILIAIFIYVLITGLRFVWSRLNLINFKGEFTGIKKWNSTMAFSGIHGTVNLAMAFSLPKIVNGMELPYRYDIIFIAELVIIMSIIIPTLILPWLLPSSDDDNYDLMQLEVFRMVNATVDNLKRTESYNPALNQVIHILNSQKGQQSIPNRREINEIMKRTSKIESETINQLIKEGRIDQAVSERYRKRRMHQNRLAFVNSRSKAIFFLKKMFNFFVYYVGHLFKGNRKKLNSRKQQILHNESIILMEKQSYRNVMKYLNRIPEGKHSGEIGSVRYYYELRHNRFRSEDGDVSRDNRLLLTTAFRHEHQYINNKLKAKDISKPIASELKHKIARDEFLYIATVNDGLTE